MWQEELIKVKKDFDDGLKKINSWDDFYEFKLTFLKRKGRLAELKKFFEILEPEDKKIFGIKFNELKDYIIKTLQEKEQEFKQHDQIKDILLHWPGKKVSLGSKHILNIELQNIIKIFNELGFSAKDSPEVVREKDNFDDLNIPPFHPARDLWSTLWTKLPHILLRTHTSAFQVPYLKKTLPPFKVIFPGKVFRFEAKDARHEIQFTQLEGLAIAERPQANLSELKWVLESFLGKFFNQKVTIRFRPSYFPFVEPGLEVDLKCFCQNGCELCSFSRYLEIAGAGMVHPYVLKQAKIHPNFQGYAFGCGLERLLMIKYRIPDIRYFLSGDLRFIKYFD